jgi:hypothetical protein
MGRVFLEATKRSVIATAAKKKDKPNKVFSAKSAARIVMAFSAAASTAAIVAAAAKN